MSASGRLRVPHKFNNARKLHSKTRRLGKEKKNISLSLRVDVGVCEHGRSGW